MKKHKILGLMSGTSLDGLDLAYCHIWSDNDAYRFDIVETKSVTYEASMQEKLKDSIFLSADELLKFHNSYGTWLGNQSKIFMRIFHKNC